MTLHKQCNRLLVACAALLSIVALSSCGSGTLAGGGIGGTGRSKGAITGFGSFILNGVEFFPTIGTTYTFDGVEGSASDLKVGMVVEVEGEFDSNGTTGSSTKVTFEDIMEGPVDSVASDGSSIMVLGQMVTLNTLTVFDNFTGAATPVPSDLVPGAIVEVSGFPTGTIRATRIEKKSDAFIPGTTVIELKGTVTDLTSTTFKIGTLIVDYSGSTVTGPLAGGKYVEVTSSQNVSGNTLTADTVEVKKAELEGTAGEKVELQGFVNNDAPVVGDFELEGTPVEITTSSEFEGGTSSDIAQNVKLEAEGSFEDRSGILVLVAESISFEEEGTIEIEGDVQQKGVNSITLLGIPVFVDTKTQYEDNSSAGLHTFSLADISINDHITIHGMKDTTGDIIATRVEREDSSTSVTLKGVVESKSFGSGITSQLIILGVTIIPTGTPQYTLNDSVVPAATFFNAINVGSTVVMAKGTLNGSVLDASELEI